MGDAGRPDDERDGATPARPEVDGGIAPTLRGHRRDGATLASGSDPQATWDLPEADRAPPRNGDALGPGARIGRFAIRARLGAGGMGVVVAADDPDLGRQVALKLVRDHAAPALRARLLREAQAMARLEHANIVRVFEVGTADGRLYIAMELVDGETLGRWLGRATRPWREVVAMFRQVGAGLAAVHRAGLVHRDFKPDNVLVDRGGHARVADFGLARLDDPGTGASASPALAAPLTRTGAMMGTPGYMAPEQQFGSDVDARADQYSFCVAMREALVARRDDTPRPVRAIIARGLSYDPSDRFASMDALLDALARASRERRIGVIAAVAAAMLVGAAVTAVVAFGRGDHGDDDAHAHGAAPAVAVFDAGAPPLPVTAQAARMREASNAAVRARMAAELPQAPAATPHLDDEGAPAAAGSAAKPLAPVRRPAPAHAAPAPDRSPGRAPDPGPGRAPDPAPDRAPDPPPAPRHSAHVVADHLDAVRAAVHDFGYQGFPQNVDDAAPGLERSMTRTRDQLTDAGIDQDPIAIADVIIGGARRRAGDCGQARVQWGEADRWYGSHSLAGSFQDMDTQMWGRAEIGTGLCMLEAGNAAAAIPRFEHAIKLFAASSSNSSERAEARVALAIARFESGDTAGAIAPMKDGLALANARVRTSAETWMTAVGLTLP